MRQGKAGGVDGLGRGDGSGDVLRVEVLNGEGLRRGEIRAQRALLVVDEDGARARGLAVGGLHLVQGRDAVGLGGRAQLLAEGIGAD